MQGFRPAVRDAIRLLGRIEARTNSERARIAKRPNSPTTLEPQPRRYVSRAFGEAAGEPQSAQEASCPTAATGDPAIPAPPLCGRRVDRDKADHGSFFEDVCKTTPCSEARSVISAFESANGGRTRVGGRWSYSDRLLSTAREKRRGVASKIKRTPGSSGGCQGKNWMRSASRRPRSAHVSGAEIAAHRGHDRSLRLHRSDNDQSVLTRRSSRSQSISAP
jgi:hypothetical protein